MTARRIDPRGGSDERLLVCKLEREVLPACPGMNAVRVVCPNSVRSRPKELRALRDDLRVTTGIEWEMVEA